MQLFHSMREKQEEWHMCCLMTGRPKVQSRALNSIKDNVERIEGEIGEVVLSDLYSFQP